MTAKHIIFVFIHISRTEIKSIAAEQKQCTNSGSQQELVTYKIFFFWFQSLKWKVCYNQVAFSYYQLP